MYKIILITHSYLSNGFLSAAELITGKQTDIEIYNILENSNISVIEENLIKTISNSNEKNQEVIVLSDLLFGTPFNILVRISEKCVFNHITGLNLAILLELIVSRNNLKLNEVIENLEELGRNNIKNFKKMLEEEN